MFWRALAVAVLAGTLALAVALEVPLCPSATLFGIPCPGCGLTRATLAALRGDLRQALAFHPLVFVLAPLYLGLLGAAALAFVRGAAHDPAAANRKRAWLAGRTATYAAWTLLAVVVGVWVARFFGAFGGPAPVNAFWELRR